MKKLLLLTSVILVATITNATTYYFSSVSGDDSRTAAQAQNSSTPWKTINKLNSFFSSLQAGDAVLFKRGETFYGSIIVTKSGSASSPIVIGAYGTGNKPVITSLVTLNNWVSKGNGIWESFNSSLGSTVNIVLLDGVQQGMGRYPNTDAANDGYLIFESHVGKTSITDNDFPSTVNFTGAELVVRTRRWILDRNIITAQSGGKISCVSTASYEPKDGYGYFIQNSIKTLDKYGEWYYNPSTQKLSVYFGSVTPSSHTVEATTIESLVFSGSYSNVTFNNLVIKGANSLGIDITKGANMAVENCDVMFSGTNGIEVNGQTNFTIENSMVSYSNNNGIHFDWGSVGALVKNNKVLNTSVIAGSCLSGDGNGVGIYDNGDGNVIQYNEIHNTGHNGIRFRGSNLTISNNLIDSFCLTKDDGAGIYSYGNYGYTGNKIMGNIVKDGIGAEAGTGTSTYSTSGIYIDHNDSKIEIRDNTFANSHDYGLYIHNSSNVTARNNTFYNNKRKQLAMIQESDYPSTVRNHSITQNIFFSKIASQTVSYMESNADDINSFGKFDSNYYARPIDDRITFNNLYAGVNKNLDLEGWKSAYGDDPNSKRSAKQIAAFKLNSILGSNRIANGTFTSGTTGTSSSSASISLGTSGLLDGGYLVVSPTAPKSTISFKVGTITGGKKYVLKYSLLGASNSDLILSAYLRFDASPYTVIADKQARKVTTNRTENEIIFVAMAGCTGSISFQADIQSKYYLDNVQFYEADASITNPDDSIKFVYNIGTSNKTVSLDGNYVDTKGSKFSNSITLAPYASAVLIKTGGSASITNNAPSVNITSPVTNSKFDAPASIVVNADAVDGDGSISKVEFYNGNTLLGTDNTSPYSFTWSGVTAGSYSITAKATDNGSLVTTSDPVSITVSNPTLAPSVSITSPVTNSKFDAPANITITASASDADGSITKVDFYSGSTFLGSDNTSPYSITWSNVAAGTYSITAKATDNSSLVTTSDPVSITVATISNIAPEVSITSPVMNENFDAPATITINATATDADGSITKVDFYNRTTYLGTATTSPYSFMWKGMSTGGYSITAKAYDNSALVTTSSAVTFTVSNPNIAPDVSITSPTANASFESPASITISANASDADGSVTNVEFYNGNTLLGSDNTSPYSFTWNNVAAGSYSITAKAIDNNALATASSTVTVSVVNPNILPTVAITSPTVNAKFEAPASITINATAADSDGSITKVDFYNGNTLVGSDNTSPYSFTLNNVAAGTYSLTAKAIDNNSAVTSSAAVPISVVNPNGAPTISLTSPTANASFEAPASITISANASDADGSVTNVEFYNGNTLLGSDNTSPYSFTWTSVAAGTYSIVAKATDNGSLTAASSAVTISVVKPNTPPTVSITAPVANSSYEAPASITITATAADTDGLVTKVDFYNGTTLLGSDNTSPYSFTWSNVASGDYSITAKATDNSSIVTISTSVSITVIAPIQNSAPTVSIISPVANTNFNAPATVTFEATAADTDGSITKVEFYNRTLYLGADSTSPYTFTWKGMSVGNYSITAKAYDNKSMVTTSDPVGFSVSNPNLAPSVSITSPVANTNYDAPASITISASATDSDGSISKVEFYNADTLLGSDDSSPYSFIWNNVTSGTYSLTAKAIDNNSLASSSSPVSISVSDKYVNKAPIIKIVTPLTNAVFVGPTNVKIVAEASDPDGYITKVEFLNGANHLYNKYTAPYSCTLADLKNGIYKISAKVTDNNGVTTQSDVVVISVVAPASSTAEAFIFKSFTGIFTGKQVKLTWSTNNTGESKYFRILKGDSKISLKEVGRVQALSSDSATLKYTFNDAAVNGGIDYYKIIEVDTLNNAVSSNIIAVDNSVVTAARPLPNSKVTSEQKNLITNSSDAISIKIGPNPTSSVLTVSTNGLQSNQEMKISIVSITGRILKTVQTNSSNQIAQINVSSLTCGLYIVQVLSGDTKIYKQFVKD